MSRNEGKTWSRLRTKEWVLKIDDDKVPRLDQVYSRIILVKDQVDVTPKQIERDTKEDEKSGFTGIIEEDTLPLPRGTSRNIGSYVSIQHQFPDTYGINGNGLEETATPQRKAQAKQLKAYLLFFDQLLANYFAQLAHVKDLFSFTNDSQVTYFTQLLDDAELGLDETHENDLGIWVNEKAARLANLQAITEDPDNSNTHNDRKNRFLNHLLARFAEQFTDYSLALYRLENPAAETLIVDKAENTHCRQAGILEKNIQS